MPADLVGDVGAVSIGAVVPPELPKPGRTVRVALHDVAPDPASRQTNCAVAPLSRAMTAPSAGATATAIGPVLSILTVRATTWPSPLRTITVCGPSEETVTGPEYGLSSDSPTIS